MSHFEPLFINPAVNHQTEPIPAPIENDEPIRRTLVYSYAPETTKNITIGISKRKGPIAWYMREGNVKRPNRLEFSSKLPHMTRDGISREWKLHKANRTDAAVAKTESQTKATRTRYRET